MYSVHRSFATEVARFNSKNNVFIQLESGDPLLVHGFVLRNNNVSGNPATIQIQSADGTSTIYNAVVPGRATVVFDIKFVADKGIRFRGSAGSTNTVEFVFYYEHTGS